MSKIIITADIHCGVGNKLEDCIWALSTIRSYASKNDINTVIVLGDLFHDRVNLNIKVLSEVSSFFDDTKYKFEQNWIVFPGNHDMFMRNSWKINSLKPIKRLITLFEDCGLVKIGDRRFRIIPFIQCEDEYMKTIERINKETDNTDVLLTHVGISGAKHNSCFLMQHWNIISFNDTKFSRVFAGHFHCNQEFGKVCIPGSPIPFRFDEGMVAHGFYTYDTESGDYKFINIRCGEQLLSTSAPPDYITISEDDIDGTSFSNSNVRVILDISKSRDELDEMRQRLESLGASKVSWMKVKEEDKQMAGASGFVESYNLFEKFLEFDQPKDLNKGLLISLNNKIIEESFELIKEEDETINNRC